MPACVARRAETDSGGHPDVLCRRVKGLSCGVTSMWVVAGKRCHAHAFLHNVMAARAGRLAGGPLPSCFPTIPDALSLFVNSIDPSPVASNLLCLPLAPL